MPKKEGRHYRFEKYEFWAERGMITLIDTELAQETHGSAQNHWRIRPGLFMKRAVAAFMHHPDMYADKMAALRNLLDNAKTACLLAKSQGDPMDENVQADFVRHKRKSSALVLPGDPQLPPMPQARQRVKTKEGSAGDVLRDGCQVVPDFSIGPKDMLTPAKAQARRHTPRR
jgi:hypothetical protein